MTYQEFIDNIIQTRGQWNIPDGEYYEKHHIVPKCMGGEGDYDNGGFKIKSTHPNCIYLTIQEHYDAHQLLFEENPHSKELALAWLNMTHVRNKERPDEYIKIDKDTYVRLREQYSKTCSGENNPAYGKNYWETHSEEKKDELRKKLSKANSGENNPMYGTSRKGLNKGRIVSEETRRKKSIAMKGHKVSEYTRELLSKKCGGWTRGTHWYNNGEIQVRRKECPEGFIPGKLVKEAIA